MTATTTRTNGAAINAQTIINAIEAAAMVAPACLDGATLDAMPECTPHDYDGAAEYGAYALAENSKYGFCYDGEQARKQARATLETMQDAARAELRALFDVPAKIKIQTSARGYMRIVNTRERLEAFSATVRSNAAAFGGGLIKAKRAKPAHTWSAGAAKTARELMQDHDHAGAYDLATEKCGAMFYSHGKGAFMLLCPTPCAELDGLTVAQHEKGHFVVFEPVSGHSIGALSGMLYKTRARAIEAAAGRWLSHSEDKRAQILANAALQKADQHAARIEWLTQYGVTIPADLATRIEAAELETSEAAQDVAPDVAPAQETTTTQHTSAANSVAAVVASAAACAAIEKASEAAALGEIATSTTSEASTPAQAIEECAALACEATASATTAEHASMAAQAGHATGHTSATPGAQYGGAIVPRGPIQQINGKTKAWSADFFTSESGAPCMKFFGAGAPQPMEFESGAARMRKLQELARAADARYNAPQEKRAPRPYTAQVLEFELRGITWKIEVNRYFLARGVAMVPVTDGPDCLTWSAEKKGGRYALQHFTRVPGDNVPRDVAARAQTFCNQCEREDNASTTTPAHTLATLPTDTPAAAAGTPAPGSGYTDTRKTSEPEPTKLHDTPQDLAPKVQKIASIWPTIDFDLETAKPEQVQALSAQAYSDLYEALEDINHHNAALLAAALRAGLDSEAQDARALMAAHERAGYMPPALLDQRRAIQARIDAAAELAIVQGYGFPPAPRDVPQDLEPQTPAPESEAAKPGAFSITITRAEGLIDECGKPATVASFAAADALLSTWSHTAPKTGGYDKCDFSIVWGDGGTYDGRYDLKHHTAERTSLTAHMVDMAEYFTGKFCPAHLSAAAYDADLERTPESTKTAYAAILETMATMGCYFPRVRPVAIDLRALVAEGVAPADLVGYGVTYCGGREDAAGVGAIIAAEPCAWAGVRVTIGLEDGRQHHTTAAQFGDKAGDRYRLDCKLHGAPYLAQLAAAYAAAKASASAAKEQAAQAHAAELARLATEYAHLQQYKQGDKLQGVTLAAANARKLLKAAFPGVKFSVTCEKFSMGNSMRVAWTDGPSAKAVEAITDQFSGGSFNGEDDSYTYSRAPFGELFGTAKYISTSRELTDSLILDCLASAWPENDGDPRPCLEDYRKAQGVFSWGHDNYWTRERMNKAIEQWTPANK